MPRVTRETFASVIQVPRQPQDRPATARLATIAKMDISGQGSSIAKREATTQFTLLNLATGGIIVAWLAVACYAIAYLVGH
jgi:hypothetical protein